jgi:purine-cytosine permease-like protein
MDAEQKSQPTPSGSEFEREPVPPGRLLGFKSFIGMYAGEHTAGTELMIGPLFVAAGVSAFDVVVGLLVGNLLAVLSWVLMCAPIATRARLTLYYQLEKICGRQLVTLYNLANGVMFCFLAGAMVTVSATALGVWFHFPMPALDDLYPNSVGWVIAVLAVGAMIALVAAYGYEIVAKVGSIAAPWMVLIFIAFGLIGLRQFIDATDTKITGLADLWTLASTRIWQGGDPQPGQVKFTFWHVMFFAWFCNMAMHIGMSDLSVLRFAKKSWYGVASGTGMFLGHYLAWLAASILYAFQLHQDPGNTKVLPGPLANGAAGLAGLVCVIIAGWTTANPTIYRAGLAFQAIFPKSSRFRVTLITGMIAAVAGMFPAIAMRLLDFVAIYGMVLMPMGAVIFIDYWVIPRLGLRSSYAELSGRSFSVAPALAWIVTVAVCLAAVFSIGRWSLWFASLPGWFLAAGLYIGLSAFYQRQWDQLPVTLTVSRVVSWGALVVLVLFTILFIAGRASLDTAKWVMLVATIVWFAGTNLWMGKEPRAPAGKKAVLPGPPTLGKTEA